VQEVALRPLVSADPAVQLDGLRGQEAQLVLVACLERVEDGVGQPVAPDRDGRRARVEGPLVVVGGRLAGGVGPDRTSVVDPEDRGEGSIELGRGQRLLHHRGAEPGPQRGAVHEVEVLEDVAGIDELAGGDLEPAPAQHVGQRQHPVEEGRRRSGHQVAL
jgi:hypothetical protein